MGNIKDSIMELISMRSDKRVDLNQEKWKVIMELSDLLSKVSTYYPVKQNKSRLVKVVVVGGCDVEIRIENFIIKEILEIADMEFGCTDFVGLLQTNKLRYTFVYDKTGLITEIHLFKPTGSKR